MKMVMHRKNEFELNKQNQYIYFNTYIVFKQSVLQISFPERLNIENQRKSTGLLRRNKTLNNATELIMLSAIF